MAKSRLIGEYPVIGIRPTIDGRRGKIKVRESLEDQTMNMAKSAAKLIEENVFYSNGEHVKVIIADTTIGRVAEAAACADKFRKRTDYTWPCTWFAPRVTGKGAFKSAYDVMNNWGANHGAISYGHIGADLITMCSMLRIPVCMHNVDEKDIYRPASWNAFGMDKEGQDYRACAAYGPLYKNIR